MNISDEVPVAFRPYFKAAGYESFRDLATAAGVAPTTPIACLKPGQRMPKPPTVDKVAAALRMTPERLRELRGDPTSEPFKLPEGSERLGSPERRAITEVVRAFGHLRDQQHRKQKQFDLVVDELVAGIVQSLESQRVFLEWLIEKQHVAMEEMTDPFLAMIKPLNDVMPTIHAYLADTASDYRISAAGYQSSLETLNAIKAELLEERDSLRLKLAEENHPSLVGLAARSEDDPKEDDI